MMSAATRTPQLVLHTRAGLATATHEQVCLTVTPQLREFLAVARQAGLDAALAVRIGFERALLLSDSGDLRVGVQRARRVLNRASVDARAKLALGATQAAYVRRLYSAALPAETTISDQLRVRLPEELLSRARETVGETALHAGAVSEMLAWERAARLEGRTMLEWGLKILATAIAVD